MVTIVPSRSCTFSSIACLAVASLWVGCSAETNAQCVGDDDCPTGYSCRSGGCYEDIIPPSCVDDDGDGFRRGPECPPGDPVDCDDGNADVNPGQAEICGDDIDQNCIAGADEGCECTSVGVGTSRDCGLGRCAGVQTCSETGWGECVPRVTPEPENCGPDGSGDGFDDDCNGVVDDGCVTCGPRPDGTGTETVCFDDAGDPSYCSSNGTC